MSFNMIDIETAEFVMSGIQIGSTIDIELSGVVHKRKVLDKSAYSVTVEGPTHKLTIPVEFTSVYKKEIDMARTPTIPGAAPTRRGRPPRETQAPVQHPTQQLPPGTPPGGWLPPGPAASSSLVGDVNKALSDVGAEQALPIALAEGEQDWVEKALDDAMDNFKNAMNAIITGVTTEIENDQPEPSICKTCFDCNNVDITENKCGKFNMVPPMNVIVNAKGMCPDFEDAIPM